MTTPSRAPDPASTVALPALAVGHSLLSTGPSLRQEVLQSSAWSIAARWVVRLLGLVNVAVLARLLGPADFGLVAMAMLVVGFVDISVAFSNDAALIQNQQAERAHFDTAFTIALVQGAVVCVIVIALAPFAVRYFKDERLDQLIWALSVGIALGSFANVGTVLLRKELRFRRDFWFQVSAKVISIVITIVAAIVLRNYWALVIGIVAGYGARTVLSYLFHPFRPRLSLAKWRDLWSISRWTLLSHLSDYTEFNADGLIIGKTMSAREFGLYSAAAELGMLPATQLMSPLSRVLLPVYARMQGDLRRLLTAYMQTLATVASVTVPAGVGLSVIADDAVILVLGAGWIGAAEVLSILALCGAMRSLAFPGHDLLTALGYPRAVALICWLSTGLFVVLGIVAVGSGLGLRGVALAKTASGAFIVVVTMIAVGRVGRSTAGDIVRALWRPVLATAAMYVAVDRLPELVTARPIVLLIDIVVGALTYGIVLVSLWAASGRPNGPEHLAIDLLQRRLRGSTS